MSKYGITKKEEANISSNNQPTTTLVIENIPSEALNVEHIIDSYLYKDFKVTEEEIDFIRAMRDQNVYKIRQDFRILPDDYQQEILEIIQNQEKEQECPMRKI